MQEIHKNPEPEETKPATEETLETRGLALTLAARATNQWLYSRPSGGAEVVEYSETGVPETEEDHHQRKELGDKHPHSRLRRLQE